MHRDRYVQASDIGTHAFCARALYLKDAGAPSSHVHAQDAGTAFHAAHGHRVHGAVRKRQFSGVLILGAFILLALAWFWR